jgi:drug/metabolite transporter (DMT)-like permease
VLAALPLALLGVLLISGVLEQGAFGRNPGRGAVFGLGAGVAYVGFLLLLRRGGADLRRPAGPLFDATATAAVLCVVAGLVVGDARLVPQWPGAGWLVILALTSQVLGWLLITVSLPRLPAALTSLLLTVQPVGSVALGALIFAEAPSGLQLFGVALVLAGLLTVSAPRTWSRKRPVGSLSRPGPVGEGQAMAGTSGSRSSASCMSASENSGSSSFPARNAS